MQFSKYEYTIETKHNLNTYCMQKAKSKGFFHVSLHIFMSVLHRLTTTNKNYINQKLHTSPGKKRKGEKTKQNTKIKAVHL